MMEFVNAAYKWETHPRSILEKFVLLLSPFAPHIAEELWQRLGHADSLAYEPWPEAEEQYLKDDMIVLPIQINGKTRGKLQLREGSGEDEAFAAVVQEKHFEKYLSGHTVRKRIYVPGRILNIIVQQNK